ncbi:hypothetical protein SERLADRAFT_410299 [Serpula lacrymans var. lacrymans S7.9]|uniref:Uncharacterized protein n=1 Tax=Serpula lacrymans var. lacrymans (strain S7.9) TaxID=578457 RepID=F8P589_SERL9|nr:uncharacterized protein SERLADRAFT_410299 [Serpula lacrymans var. lacrymans S7.9]EGO21776.1 hypothetical protein SERLADRAFT_410299 [Serpula lacrymans var. lacrymans S7.9]
MAGDFLNIISAAMLRLALSSLSPHCLPVNFQHLSSNNVSLWLAGFTLEMFTIIDKWVTVPVITLFVMLVSSELGMASFLVYYDNLHLSDIVAALYETLGVCTGGTPKWFSIFFNVQIISTLSPGS